MKNGGFLFLPPKPFRLVGYSFELQEACFQRKPSGIAGKPARTADDPMTGYDNSYGIAVASHTHRTRSGRRAHSAGYSAVSARIAVGNFQQGVPHGSLKRCPCGRQGQRKLPASAVEIFAELQSRLPYRRRFPLHSPSKRRIGNVCNCTLLRPYPYRTDRKGIGVKTENIVHENRIKKLPDFRSGSRVMYCIIFSLSVFCPTEH